MIVIGIDVGGTNTKIVGLRDGVPMEPIHVRATDPITSVFGALGKYISLHQLTLQDISKVMVTGVGSSFLHENIFNIPTEKVEEFHAVGRGGLYLSGLKKAVIVSLGTGTAFVMADGNKIAHMGGTGVGGGTLTGLSSRMLNVRSFDSIMALAKDGDLSRVDLSWTKKNVSTMPLNTTASNFGKIADDATKCDIAAGLLNLVFQTVGIMAVFASSIAQTKEIVLCGRLANAPQAAKTMVQIHELHHVNFIIPQHAEFATALGCALVGL